MKRHASEHGASPSHHRGDRSAHRGSGSSQRAFGGHPCGPSSTSTSRQGRCQCHGSSSSSRTGSNAPRPSPPSCGTCVPYMALCFDQLGSQNEFGRLFSLCGVGLYSRSRNNGLLKHFRIQLFAGLYIHFSVFICPHLLNCSNSYIHLIFLLQQPFGLHLRDILIFHPQNLLNITIIIFFV